MNARGPYIASQDATKGVMEYDEDAATVLVRDAVVLVCGGRIVARAHAMYDVSDVPDEFRDQLFRQFGRILHDVLPADELIRSALVLKVWRRRIEQYEERPWWRRVFSRRPQISAVSDAYDRDHA